MTSNIAPAIVNKRNIHREKTMPAIKVYKANGLVIPFEEAKVGKAYRCPFTNKIYSTKRAYVTHLQKYRATTIRRNNSKQRWQRKLENLRNQTSIDNIIQWIEMNPEFFINNIILDSFADDRKYLESIICDFNITVTRLVLNYSNNVSNSHSAPFGKRTNWGGRVKDAPRGYPGWQGSISFTMSHEVPSFTTNMFNNTGINIGSGGGGGLKFQYTVELFEDDWPGLAKSRTLDILSQK